MIIQSMTTKHLTQTRDTRSSEYHALCTSTPFIKSKDSDHHHWMVIVARLHQYLTSGFRGEVVRIFSNFWPTCYLWEQYLFKHTCRCWFPHVEVDHYGEVSSKSSETPSEDFPILALPSPLGCQILISNLAPMVTCTS